MVFNAFYRSELIGQYYSIAEIALFAVFGLFRQFPPQQRPFSELPVLLLFVYDHFVTTL
jgi:hypothetical protein